MTYLLKITKFELNTYICEECTIDMVIQGIFFMIFKRVKMMFALRQTVGNILNMSDTMISIIQFFKFKFDYYSYLLCFILVTIYLN